MAFTAVACFGSMGAGSTVVDGKSEKKSGAWIACSSKESCLAGRTVSKSMALSKVPRAMVREVDGVVSEDPTRVLLGDISPESS